MIPIHRGALVHSLTAGCGEEPRFDIGGMAFPFETEGPRGDYVIGLETGSKHMTVKSKPTPAIAIQQAELILHLYELRRETVMREARSYIGGEFLPASAAEFLEIVNAGGKHTAFVLQVYGYWDMVAAFVEHGALDATLVYNTCQEMYFQYAKIQPYLAEFRKQMMLPEWLISVERVTEGSTKSRKRLAAMQKSLAAMADLRAAKPSQS
jgi:hypothetical protein